MGLHTVPQTNIEYALIAYDGNGNERPESGALFSQSLIQKAKTDGVTNVFFFSHGWQGDLPAAIAQYDKWLKTLGESAEFRNGSTAFPGFKPLLIGLHWPSLPFGDEGDGTSFAAGGLGGPQAIVDEYLERLGDRPEIRRALEVIVEAARHDSSPDELPPQVVKAYQDLNTTLGLGSAGVSAPPDADREGFDPEETYQAAKEEGAEFGGLSLSALLAPLRTLSYWTMKKRARSIGETGMHNFLKALQTACPTARVHLMGHSFGTIVVSGMLSGPNATGTLVRPVDSVALVQGAVSLWCYADAIPFAGAGTGYFRNTIAAGKVKGPIVTTQSKFDRAVGTMYPLASRVSGSASFGGQFPEFGAIGTFGLQGLKAGVGSDAKMLAANGDYGFEHGKVYNLESSGFIKEGGGASGAHSDIAGPEVAHAIWQAAVASK